LGSAGSGKSTLSRKLGSIFDLPVIHLDRYYWNPNWVPTSDEEWDQRVEALSRQERWIMDGNYSRTLDIRIGRADTIIFLDMPTLLCIYRVIKRRVMYHRKTRPDLNERCPEKLDWAFLKWGWNFRRRSRPRVVQKLQEASSEKQNYHFEEQKTGG
jgi:adenylate kinase family enzyme